MSIELLQTVDIIEEMENFIENNRPPEDLREQLDLAYKIEDQSVIIYEIRPHWEKPGQQIECNIAKATFVKASGHWKIFCLRSSLKWDSYKPIPAVKSLKEFLKIIKEDKHSCF